MDFGKNRVQYNNFVWQFYRYDKYDIYFYYEGKELALFTGYIANKKISEIENILGYTIDRRIIFVVYDKLSCFKQSNIGLVSGNNQYNIGGVTKMYDNKVFLYYEGDHKKFENQITAAIAEVIINEFFYGNKLKNKVTNSYLLSLPEWYIKGLISYVSNNWDMNIENQVKDGILSRKYEKFNRLSGDDAIYAGHSIWNYVAEKYGKSVITNILYYTKNQKNIESGFLNVLGTPLKFFTNDWLNYYDEKYYKSDKKRDFPINEYKFKKNKPNKVFQQIKTSPDNKRIAYVTNTLGQYKIFIYDTLTKKNKRIFKKEYKLEQITDYSYPILAWHPSGEILSFIIEYKGGIWLYFYELSTKNLEKRQLFNFQKILDYSYSDNGFNIVMSAVQNGRTDIFNFNIPGNTAVQITNDLYDDFSPRFIENSKKIIFSSDRLKDSLFLDKNERFVNRGNTDIFNIDFKNKSKVLTRITYTPYFNESEPFELKKHFYLTLSDANGVINRFVAKYDSTISFIDTSIHYSFYTTIYPLTNYKRNILEHDINYNTSTYSELLYSMGKYHVFSNKLNLNKNSFNGEIFNSEFRNKLNKYYVEDSINKKKAISQQTINALKDSLNNKRKTIKIVSDTNNININNYIFEKEKKQINNIFTKNDTNKINKELIIPQPRIYLTSFYTNYLVSQVDFGFLNSSYQTFTGGAVYFNPGANLFVKLGTNDLFEDYKITGGIRIPYDLESSEYILSIENLKKRTDKQVLFHRQAFKNIIDNSIVKSLTHEMMYILKYPFSQVSAVKATLSLRYNNNVYLSTDVQNLRKNNDYKTWSGLKIEYIFDNTIDKGLNLFNGTRMKIFGEAYKQIDGEKTDLFVVGGDYRHYQKIHRNLIWASRVAASSSFGQSKLIYYLGSVDNWINTSRTVETFDNSIPIDNSQNYAYQTLATDMRGFTQNIRNGNSFAVINNEIRWPIIKYFSNYPINSDLLSNFQIVGFFDIGTAWSGNSPYSKKNAYNTDIINNGPITLIIDKNRDPIVYGYGVGLRTKFLGYFFRLDWAWGIENGVVLPRIFYLSLSLDF